MLLGCHPRRSGNGHWLGVATIPSWMAVLHPCLCGCDDWSLLHALRVCPLFSPWRRIWVQRLPTLSCNWDVLSDDSLLRPVFAPQEMGNTRSSTIAHVLFVASVCRAQRSLLEGLEC